ncbi:hypothetical protein F4777DRAFT_536331 [Nemania sp. FL0916]|nr:hypothetical protein F4777DRAFT_536331 [Nemania sp. FL0916]
MGTTIWYSTVLTSWLLVGHVLSYATASPTSVSMPTNLSPSLSYNTKRDISETAKTGISVGVTLGALFIIGSTAILCIKRGRKMALARPETRTEGPEDIDDTNTPAHDNVGKGEEAYYMSTTSNPSAGMAPQAPAGFVYQGEYPTMPDQRYAPQQPTHAMVYPNTYSEEAYGHSATAYSRNNIIDPSQQNGYAGPSNTQYQGETQLYPRQQPQQWQGAHTSWENPASTTPPGETAPMHDLQPTYLQDYQPYAQSPSPDHGHYRSRDASVSPGYGGGDDMYIPPPRPDASELPEQRRPIELMGEGHYQEAP